jgi:phenylacetate-CoA ligase
MSVRQLLIRHLTYPLSHLRSGDAAQLRYIREFERTQYLPADELRALQESRLRELLDHAYRHCPFYRLRFEQADLLPSDICRLEDLQALPILEKTDVQEHRDRLVADNWPMHDLIPNQTGGSVGRPVSFFLSRDRCRSRAAATVRHNRWAGWDLGDKIAVLWGAPRDRPTHSWRGRLRRLLIEPQLHLDAGHVTEASLTAFHAALQRYRPRGILAYASAAVLFARFLKARGLQPYQPYSLVTSAEVLTDEERVLLEEVFGCPVFNRYGSREVSVLASECAAHRGLHVMAEGLYLEIVRGDRPAVPGEVGSILVTDLLNRAMPLIRYRIGDLGSWAAGACPCGRSLPRLQSVAGRVTDFLVGADGRLVSGAFLTIQLVAPRPRLGQVQIRQDTPGRVRFRIKPGPEFDSVTDLAYLERTARQYLGEGTVVEHEYVAEMPAEPSGKFLFCRSTVTPEFLRTAPPVPGRARQAYDNVLET